MKIKIIIPVLLIFALFAACTQELAPVENLDKTEAGASYISLGSTRITLPENPTGTLESITLDKLRILVFSKATGAITGNKSFDISGLNPVQQDDNSWLLDVSHLKVRAKAGASIVYAVLNENIATISGQTLTAALDAVANLAAMEALVKTPVSYATALPVTYKTDGVTPDEPPFIMCTFDEFTIPVDRPESNPYQADLRGTGKGFEMDRTMAKVTLKSVSNKNLDGTDLSPTEKLSTSYIFILKMGLRNVPNQYIWSPNRLPVATPNPNPYPQPLSPYTGSYQEIDFALENPTLQYYERNWDGSITATATANVTWTQYGTGDIYKIKDNNGVKSYGVVPPATPYEFDTTTPGINQGNFLDFLKQYFTTDGQGTTFDLENIVYSNTQVTPTVTAGNWELLEKDISYYVPEHILQDKSNPAGATKLYVKAAKASIPFDASGVQFNQNNVNWVKSENEIVWTYPTETEIGAMMNSSFQAVPVTNKPGYYHHRWSGSNFWRKATGTITLTLTGLKFGDIVNSAITKEFLLPIQNSPVSPADYNIYRNHEYKFSVHLLEPWLEARSAGSDSFGGIALGIEE